MKVTGEDDGGDAVVDEYRSKEFISFSANNDDAKEGEKEEEKDAVEDDGVGSSSHLPPCDDPTDLRDITERCAGEGGGVTKRRDPDKKRAR